MRRQAVGPFRVAVGLAALLIGSACMAATCTVSATSLAFGSYNPISGLPTAANATVTLRCTNLLPQTVNYRILLSAGNSGSTANRFMSAGGANLAYNIFTSASYATVWDNSTGIAGSLMVTGIIFAQGTATLTAYGRILAGQLSPAGVYGDTLVITVNY